MKKLLLITAIAAAIWQTMVAQTAQDLEIEWSKEYGLTPRFIVFSDDGKFIYLAEDYTRKISKFSLESRQIIKTYDFICNYDIKDMNISKNGKYLTVSSYKNTYILDLETGKLIKEFSEDKYPTIDKAYCADIGKDNNTLYIGIMGPPSGFWILVYDLAKDKEITRLKLDSYIYKIKVSNNGKYFATGLGYRITIKGDSPDMFYNKLILWDTESLNQVACLENEDVYHLSEYFRIKFSPDDGVLACMRRELNTGYNMMLLFDLKTNKLIRTSNPERSISTFELLPDNNHYLLSFQDQEIHTLEMHNLNSLVKEYKINNIDIVESYNTSGKWKIICYKWPKLTVLTNNMPNSIENKTYHNFSLNYHNGYVILEIEEHMIHPIKISIYNTVGKIVYINSIVERSNDCQFSFNVSLTTGLYIANLNINGKDYTSKFIVAE